jgi:vitamin B12 transporter
MKKEQRMMKMNFSFFNRMSVLTLLAPLNFIGQDTTLLQNVEVLTIKNELSSTGKRIDSPDSNARQLFIFQSIADLLSNNSTVYIKNYGPGSLASSSIRGGNASQTALLWNGFNIQNPMLGQSDLSLLPSVLFDDIKVEYGGSSSLWGSGAVGGGIQMKNKTEFGKGWGTKVNLGAGSFNTSNASSNISYSNHKFFSSTRSYFQSSNNNFRYTAYKGDSAYLKEQKYAAFRNIGFSQDFKLLVGKASSLNLNAWYNKGDRQLPTVNESKFIPAIQKDESIRLTAGWNRTGVKWNNGLKGAFISDRIDYIDEDRNVNDKSRSYNMIVESENIYRYGNSNQLMFGLNYTNAQAQTPNYNGMKGTSKLAFLAGNRFSFLENKLLIYPLVRAEYFSAGTIPLTGNLAIEYKLAQEIKAGVNAGKVYRQPTLNELYWYPGGNPKLLPEQGYTIDGDLSYSKQFSKITMEISGSAYSRQINNWILWLPGSQGSPSPQNIQAVWSRGTESRWKIGYLKDKLFLSLNVFTSYALSTILGSQQENDNVAGRQLIYTPRYTVNGNFTFGYGSFSITYFHQYVGYRFTTSDNTQWLDPYHYSSLRINIKSLMKQETKTIFYAACNNLWNVDYSVVAGRPMPLRSVEFGISLNAVWKKKDGKSDE